MLMIDYSIIDFTSLRKVTSLECINNSQVRTCPINYWIKQVIAFITLEWERVV